MLLKVNMCICFAECPRDYGPTAGEIIPGDVTNVAVAFVKQKTENSQGWVARVNWTAPKGMNQNN